MIHLIILALALNAGAQALQARITCPAEGQLMTMELKPVSPLCGGWP